MLEEAFISLYDLLPSKLVDSITSTGMPIDW